MSEKLSKEIIDQLNDAWLNIDVKNSEIINPFEILRTDDPDEFHMKFTWLLMNPEYFCFICRHILNIDILPMQAMMLREMWSRKFPMLVGSRGLGKAEWLYNPVLTEFGWRTMGSLKVGDRVYSRSGKLCNITGVYPQGKKQLWNIKFYDGRTIDCCEDHLWTVKKGSSEKVLSTKEMYESGVVHRCNNNKYTFKYKVPLLEPIDYPEANLPLDPYLLGCLLGNGSLTTATPKIATDDQFIVDEFRKRLPNFKIEKDVSCNNYTIVDKDTSYDYYKCSHKHRNSFTALLCENGLNVNCEQKFIPEVYKTASIEQRMDLVRGLLDTDGHCTKDGHIEFSNLSEGLVDDLIDVLRSLGIACIKSHENREGQTFKNPSGKECVRKKQFRIYINTAKPVFKLPRKLKNLKKTETGRGKYNAIIEITPTEIYDDMQCISVDSPDSTYITKDYIVTHNTFLLSVYCLLRALLIPNRKIVVVGSAFRQSRYLHDYMENIWKNAPILRDLCDDNSGPRRDVDMCKMTLNNSTVVALPIGDGSKIRGQRANDIVADEFASMNLDIFENVIAGFAAVSASPAENVKRMAKEKMAKEKGIPIEKTYSDKTEIKTVGNQIILSGTAYYDFNHFASYWRRWKNIINTKGDPHRIKMDVFNGEEPPASFNWKDYSIIRIPVDLVPKGFMDEGQIARSKATIHNGIYLMEFSACFTKDSQGFFKRSLIESCVGTDQKPVKTPSGDVFFDPVLFGNKNSKYIMGVDPASEVDNFSIVILEVREDHRRLVYCWTTTRKDHTEKVKSGVVKENNFYSYCARKIRDLMKVFPIVHIAMDAQGGGISVSEALHDHSQLLADEMPIWPIIEEDKEKPSDDEKGLHILELCQFAKYEWYSEANHGLRKDLEDKNLIFPRFDSISIGLSLIDDKNNNRTHDTFEDCVMEIEELKSELSMIEVTQSINGRDRWDTPEIKAGHGKKKRLRKDRYSSLLMANMAARTLMRTPEPKTYLSYGGFAQGGGGSKNNLVEYIGPAWFTDSVKNIY